MSDTVTLERTEVRSRRGLIAAAISSAVLGVVGTALLARPDGNPLLEPDAVLLRTVLSGPAVTVVVIALGLLGALTSAYALARPSVRVTAVAAVQVLGLGVALQSVSTMALAGYLVAMALPFASVALAVQAVRRYRRLRWVVLAAALLVLTVGWLAGSLRPNHLAGLASNLGRGFATHSAQLIMVALIGLAAAAWVVVLAGGLRGRAPVRRFGDWTLRHRRGLTVLAALGPVPYALVRASWLTPWPLLVPDAEMIDPEMRLWGLLLGGGAAVGVVLTLGLIRPWGVVFPRWMPRWAGRPVPVRAATIPGGIVAGVICAAAAPMAYATLSPAAGMVFDGLGLWSRLGALLIFPFWGWGPALALAVWAYARSRRDPASRGMGPAGDRTGRG